MRLGGRERIQLVRSTCRNNSDVFMQEIGLIPFVFFLLKFRLSYKGCSQWGFCWLPLFLNSHQQILSLSGEWGQRFRTREPTQKFENTHCNHLILFTLHGFVSKDPFFPAQSVFEIDVIIKVFKQNFLY